MIKYNELSKIISHALRHAPWEYELELDDEGWVNIDDLIFILNNLKSVWINVGFDDLIQMINQSSKKRFEMNSGKIRASYGHSTPEKLLKVLAQPPEYLYHGTSPDIAKLVLTSELIPMSRHHVHMSTDILTAKEVGLRKSSHPTILIINAKNAFQDGIAFYRGNSTIWLADKIPGTYLSIIQTI